MDEYAGHKTFYEGSGHFRHEPLTRSEADAIRKQIEESARRRRETYPDEQACVRAMFDAMERLKELGWKDTTYAPADHKIKQTISLGTTGIHDAYCDKTDQPPFLPRKWWWHPSEDGDLWPHSPILYKDKDAARQAGEK